MFIKKKKKKKSTMGKYCLKENNYFMSPKCPFRNN